MNFSLWSLSCSNYALPPVTVSVDSRSYKHREPLVKRVYCGVIIGGHSLIKKAHILCTAASFTGLRKRDLLFHMIDGAQNMVSLTRFQMLNGLKRMQLAKL